MKLQFALVDPDLVTRGTTVMVGIVVSDRVFNDYDVMPIQLSSAIAGAGSVAPVSFLVNDHHLDNLAKRNDYPEDVLNASFTHVLKLPVWRTPLVDVPAGEIALVKTQMPGLEEGEHAYATFGIIKGDHAELKAMSNKVFESTAPLAPGVMTSGGVARYTGTEVAHTMGSSLLNVLTQHVWGFGPEKLAVKAMITIDQFKGFAANNQHLIDHGVNLSEEFGRSRPDAQYLDYLRKMAARGLVPAPMCETLGESKIREQAASEIMREQLVDERSDELTQLAKKLGVELSPER